MQDCENCEAMKQSVIISWVKRSKGVWTCTKTEQASEQKTEQKDTTGSKPSTGSTGNNKTSEKEEDDGVITFPVAP